MKRSAVFTVDENGDIVEMRPAAPRDEDSMQALVARHPAVIEDEDGELLLIRREQPIADGLENSGRWSVDHLFVTRKAIPVLVELKRAVDTRLRREVVGQLLDYAANAAAYWKPGKLAEAFSISATAEGKDPAEVLDAFLEGGAPDDFWASVDANFSAGNLKLVFVADTIPSELARVVEFLNDQMRADVRAVELAWFTSLDGSLTTLAPRIIGQTEQSKTAKNPQNSLPELSKEDWLKLHIAPLGVKAMSGAMRFLEIVESLGCKTGVTGPQASIYVALPTASGLKYPFFLNRYKNGNIQFSTGYIKDQYAFPDEAERQELYDDLVGIVGPLSTRSLNGSPSFDVALLCDSSIRENFQKFAADLFEELAKRAQRRVKNKLLLTRP
tara:strand:- start:130 stop:1284 length:1155 start_codon:yes stop_codon:yes gene_type:complete